LETIAEAGADLIEIGVPFSDPLADGPTIQYASQIAIQNGIVLNDILKMTAEFKAKHDVPILLMGYANPFFQFGLEKLPEQAGKAGVSGFIIPDLPPDECQPILADFSNHDLELIFLAAPNTSSKRLQEIDRLSSAFIYAVSITGVTGVKEKLPEETKLFLSNLHQLTERPILVGFGISGPGSAKKLLPYCDGVIIGSAVIQIVRESADLYSVRDNLFEFIKEMKVALENKQ
jgi:tryptophan synthase alpha chain